MRGVLAGVCVGALVASASAVLWSLSVPLPQVVQVGEAEPTLSAAPGGDDLAARVAPAADADLVEVAPTAPDLVSTQEPSTQGDIDRKPATLPEAATTVDAEPAPAPPEEPVIAGAADTPVTPHPTPGAVGHGAQTSAADDPMAQDETPKLPADPQRPSSTSLAPQAQLVPPSSNIDLPPSADETPQAQPSVAVLPTIPDMPLAESGSTDSGLPEEASEPAPEPVRIGDLPQASQDGEVASGQSNGQSTGPSSGPTIGTPVRPLTDRSSTTLAADHATAQAIPPFERNAEALGADEGRPLMSIVLLEDAHSVGAEALADFPYPLTFAIDPSAPDAAARMKERRAAGFEVMILADLPREATPQDAETALPVWFSRLPDAMGVIEGVKTGFQGNRALADQVSAVVADAGYGLVTQDNGLNTLSKMALRDGVPAGVVFRDFDGAGQNARAMRRFLDQAAFRANQSGAVIMLGRLKPDTISSLIVWGLQDRASRVTLAPVSASLKRNLAPVE